MKLQEAYRIKDVSEEEIKSVQRYLGSTHTAMNFLANFDPNSYEKLSKSWLFPKTEDELRKYIQDFANIYSVMYKTSKSQALSERLVRGTSKDFVPKTGSEIERLVSCSTDENVAKRFCEYQNAALLHITPSDDIPFINVEDFKERTNDDSASEAEIILAPFCKVRRQEHSGDWDGYSHYSVTVEKPQLPTISEEEITSLMSDVINGFAQNLEDMKEYIRLRDMSEIWNERYRRSTDPNDKQYILEQKQKDLYNFFEKSDKVLEYRNKLQTLLKGICRQKELEFEQARSVIVADMKKNAGVPSEEIEQESIAEEKVRVEAERTRKVSEVSRKLTRSQQNEIELERTILDSYQSLVNSEQIYSEMAQMLEVNYSKVSSKSSIKEKVQAIKDNIKKAREALKGEKVPEDVSSEEISQIAKRVLPLTDGVAYGIEVARDMTDVVDLHSKQSEKEIKRNLYFKVQRTIQDAKVQKLLKDKKAIEKEKIGFFGGFTGKNDLQLERIRNVSLKMELVQTTPIEEQEHYSVRDMLADLYVCSMTELGGKFTPEMTKLYKRIKKVFGMNDRSFSDQDIQTLARGKIIQSADTLPVVQKPGRSFLGKNRAQTELLKLENRALQEKINANKSRGKMPQLVSSEFLEEDAIVLFELKLKGIESATRKRESRNTDLDKTLDLWD